MGLPCIQHQPQAVQHQPDDLHGAVYSLPAENDKVVGITHQVRTKLRFQLVPLPDSVQQMQITAA